MSYLKTLVFVSIIFSCFISCKENPKTKPPTPTEKSEFIISFGSCNNQILHNNFWNEILKNNPNIWIWGGDIIYSNTTNKNTLEQNYTIQKNNVDYQNFCKKVPVTGTWDDNDYGKNDGGTEYILKKDSQQLFLDFFDIPKNDARRKQEGVYHAIDFPIHNKSVKIIVLDTRYFRTALTPDTISTKRYIPNTYNKGTMLGKKQWEWLENELNTSKATFNIIVSSIQVLSATHGFETWANMPHEIDKLETLLKTSSAKNCILLSGDRHASEFSKKDVDGLPYPLIDFTSSGLTHSGPLNKIEENTFRIGKLITTRSFGIIKLDLIKSTAHLEIRGDDNELFEKHIQSYQ